MGMTGSQNGNGLQESTNDAKSNSLDDYAHLTSTNPSKTDPIEGASSRRSMSDKPLQEQLSTNLSLFMSNMNKVDTDRKKQIEAATITDGAKTERYILELEAEGTDFHTIFKN